MKHVVFTMKELLVLQKIFDIAESMEFEDNIAEYHIFCDMYDRLFVNKMED